MKIEYLLDSVRGIAQQGLTFAESRYDRERYQRLLDISANQYAEMAKMESVEVKERFARELGYVTAKVGVDAAIFNNDGHLLILKRPDSIRWALPGGWVDPGETAELAIEREVFEEVGLKVTAREVVAVNSRVAGNSGNPHSSIHIMFECVVEEGNPQSSPEALEIEYVNARATPKWHEDHGMWVRKCFEWHSKRRGEEND